MENLPIQGPVFLIEVDRISPNPQQPRRDFNEEELKELAASIREFGILQPIIVTKIERETELGTAVDYQLIAGERRWRASKMAGMERIPAIIKNVSLDRDRLELAILENVQRANLSPIEAARAYAKLQDEFKLTQREIAARLGKSRESVANTMRLLSLPTQVQEAVAKGQVSESQGRLLLTVEDINQQNFLFEDILRNNLSVRELKTKIERNKQQQRQQTAEAAAPEPAVAAANPELDQIKKDLETALGTPVKLEQDGATGKLTITFYSPEELRGIVQKLL
ncbi:MAG: ParB/RepB/Spo0J family partition protein [Patescibacteria group bacterium]|mgnify:FL=1